MTICVPLMNILLSCCVQPIVGTDANLKMNLESYFKLDYPKVRSVFGVVLGRHSCELCNLASPISMSFTDFYSYVNELEKLQ